MVWLQRRGGIWCSYTVVCEPDILARQDLVVLAAELLVQHGSRVCHELDRLLRHRCRVEVSRRKVRGLV